MVRCYLQLTRNKRRQHHISRLFILSLSLPFIVPDKGLHAVRIDEQLSPAFITLCTSVDFWHEISISLSKYRENRTATVKQEAKVIWQKLHRMTPAQWSRRRAAACWQTDGQTDRETPRTSVTIVCISCIGLRLKTQCCSLWRQRGFYRFDVQYLIVRFA